MLELGMRRVVGGRGEKVEEEEEEVLVLWDEKWMLRRRLMLEGEGGSLGGLMGWCW